MSRLQPEALMEKLRPGVYPRHDYWGALQMMANRMGVSEHKYGPLEENYPHKANSMAEAARRIGMYVDTGNTEWLLDAANQLIIEHLFPSHEKAHFNATGSEASPGIMQREPLFAVKEELCMRAFEQGIHKCAEPKNHEGRHICSCGIGMGRFP